MKIDLGNTVRDVVTGLTGIVTAEVRYLTGCTQFCVLPPMRGDKYPEGQYIDAQRLEFVDAGVMVTATETGGVMSDTPPATYRG
jgi:hypothetical protein